ncbi:organic cation transporter 1-like [Limulus polyphemus]|uniref:Organic cation transporter 1-like n=1 Tax=Limulus polyphemus TaxID=6850 RepID=A0ABM1C1F3_LIMPO|nr:organic cation transporter 1-like [Limulus polyphemus]
MKIGQTMDREKQEEKSHSLLDFFKFPQLRKKLCIITLNWSSIAVAYFGLTINISNLGGNDFLNYFCLSVIELPAFVLGLYLMDRWGRKWTNTLFVTTAGLFCLMPVFMPPRLKVLIMVASVMGKFGSAAAFMVIYQQATELYPTPVRSMGMSIGSMVSSIAIICMPYVVYLGTYNKFIPFLIIGGMCVTAGLLAPLVPETLHENLPQTLEESEKFGVGQKFFSCVRSTKRDTTDESEENAGGEPISS